MSKSFRQRKLDSKRLLPVLREWEVDENDLAESRAVTVETGVEKEEEEEEHLKQLIAKKTNDSIPTPDASHVFVEYERFYKAGFEVGEEYIKHVETVEEVIGVVYCVDQKDREWVERQKGLDICTFEVLVLRLEKLCKSLAVVGFEEFENHLKSQGLVDLITFATDIYAYWKERVELEGRMLPSLRTEETDGIDYDPYVCFRRRELKNIRKTRRSDMQTSDRLRKLRGELSAAKQLLELISKREKLRYESLLLETTVFEKRACIRQWKRQLNITQDEPPKPKRKKKEKTTITIPLRKLKDVSSPIDGDLSEAVRLCMEERPSAELLLLANRMQQSLRIKREGTQDSIDITETPYQPLPKLPHAHYTQRQLRVDSQLTVPLGRRRIGRGGRIMFDRVLSFSSMNEPVEKLGKYRFDLSESEEETHVIHDPENDASIAAAFYDRIDLQQTPLLMNGMFLPPLPPLPKHVVNRRPPKSLPVQVANHAALMQNRASLLAAKKPSLSASSSPLAEPKDSPKRMKKSPSVAVNKS